MMLNRMSVRVLMGMLLLVLVPSGAVCAVGDVIYVNDDAPPGGDGASWATAYATLYHALDVASDCEIWVAEGTYFPDTAGLADPSEATFQLKNGVRIYGGFIGIEDPATFDLDTRYLDVNETILSGDIGIPGDRSDNCYQVFFHPSGTNLDNSAVLDGVTITGGHAVGWESPHGFGGGMFNEFCSPTLINCTFSDNWANQTQGGGIYNTSSSPTLTNCTFSDNEADFGGGMCNVASSPTLNECEFLGNGALEGGGMYNTSSSSPILIDCTFSDNAAEFGGGMDNSSSSSPTLTSCTFSGNSVTLGGGGGMSNTSCLPTLIDCTFSGNSASSGVGGGMYNDASTPTLTNCVFSDNVANQTEGGGMYNTSSSPILTNCTFSGNFSDFGAGMCNVTSSPTLNDCHFSGNSTAMGDGGGMFNISSSSPTLTDCTFSDNGAEFGGGMHNNSSNPILTNCTFSGNSAGLGGGAGMSNYNSNPTLTNCIFSHNSATITDGGGMYNTASAPVLTNCTFVGNYGGVGGGMYNRISSSPRLTNCILWGNTATVNEYREIYNSNLSGISQPDISYCDIQGSGGSDAWDTSLGTDNGGNIDAVPLFRSAASGDVHLLTGSPCIDAGDNAAPNLPATDFEGDDRRLDDLSTVDTGNGTAPIVDMGVDEYVPPACWSIALTATSSEGTNDGLYLGVCSEATDGYDSGTDTPHPPPGPAVTFDAHFVIDDPLFPQLDGDYRGSADCWEWVLHAESSSSDIALDWDAGFVPPDVVFHMDTGFELIDMQANSSTVLPPGSHTITISTCGACLNLPLKAGWNMVSVPLALEEDSSVAAVFPGAEIVYGWNSVSKSYVMVTEIEPHQSYWVAVIADTEVSICGVPVRSWTVDVVPGWNMVGSAFEAVDFTSPDDTPNGCVESFVFTWTPFSSSYWLSTTIEPMGGYWVAATQAGTLTVSCH